MTEPALSNRARKKKLREGKAQGTARSQSIDSDAAKKDEPSPTATPLEGEPDLKGREGVNPFVDVLQKKVRNLSKRKVRNFISTLPWRDSCAIVGSPRSSGCSENGRHFKPFKA